MQKPNNMVIIFHFREHFLNQNRIDLYAMGNAVGLLSKETGSTDEKKVASISYVYRNLRSGQNQKLNELFDVIISKAAIDYRSQEMKDIKYAVKHMLRRVASKMNKQGIFKLSRIQPGGSMAEKTSIWKYDSRRKETYIEFDFLGVLVNSPEPYCHLDKSDNCGWSCPGCIEVKDPPVDFRRLGKFYNEVDQKIYTVDNLRKPGTLNTLFLHEQTFCLASLCQCLSVSYLKALVGTLEGTERTFQSYTVSPKFHREQSWCNQCVVVMPTGFLKVSTSRETAHGNACSLIFIWKSKAKTLSVPDRFLLKESKPIKELPIYVDFLPALELLKPGSAKSEHVSYFVPKRCNACRLGGRPNWRKSGSNAEINAFVKELSDTHIKCYKILKYLAQVLDPDNLQTYVKNYHIKTVTLHHSTSCPSSSDDYAECVMTILHDLRYAYKVGSLKCFDTAIETLDKWDVFNSNSADTWQNCIDKFCSVTVTDTWETVIRKFLKSEEKEDTR